MLQGFIRLLQRPASRSIGARRPLRDAGIDREMPPDDVEVVHDGGRREQEQGSNPGPSEQIKPYEKFQGAPEQKNDDDKSCQREQQRRKL